jgi:GDPmannose 4,6-dehydratase
MWLMLQQETPDDYVVATGAAHSVRDLVELAFREVGLDWRNHVEMDSRYLRPSEVDFLQGDASKARTRLGWQPKVDFASLVRMMVAHDLELARREQTMKDAGFDDPRRGTASEGRG